ncbi:MAG: hypothetical protein SEPTF4163_000541 [Sporothrix epigloea]
MPETCPVVLATGLWNGAIESDDAVDLTEAVEMVSGIRAALGVEAVRRNQQSWTRGRSVVID